MNLQAATSLRALLASIEAIIAQELDKATPPIIELPPIVIDPPTPGEVIDGFSRHADADGFVTIPAVDVILSRLPKRIRVKLPDRFCFEQSYRKAIFPDDIAREKCARNLCARFRSPIQVPPQFNFDALLFRVESVPKPGIEQDFNALPEYRNSYVWHEDLAMIDGNRAYSSDCNPAFGAAEFTALVQARADAEMEAAGLKPTA